MFRGTDQRTLAGTAATLSWLALDGDGSAHDPGTVTVSVSSSDGTALVVDAATSTDSTRLGLRAYSLTATHTASVDRLTATWKVAGAAVATTSIDVVGAYLVPLTRLGLDAPAAVDEMDVARQSLVAKRNAAEDRLETILGWSPRLRYTEEVHEAPRCGELLLDEFYPHHLVWCELIDCTGNVTRLTPTELQAVEFEPHGAARRTDGQPWGWHRVRLGYVHGRQAPADLVDAAVKWTAHSITSTRSGIPARATSVTTQEISYTLASPGSDRWATGIEEIDSVLMSYRHHRVGIS